MMGQTRQTLDSPEIGKTNAHLLSVSFRSSPSFSFNLNLRVTWRPIETSAF